VRLVVVGSAWCADVAMWTTASTTRQHVNLFMGSLNRVISCQYVSFFFALLPVYAVAFVFATCVLAACLYALFVCMHCLHVRSVCMYAVFVCMHCLYVCIVCMYTLFVRIHCLYVFIVCIYALLLATVLVVAVVQLARGKHCA
jgi:hypothetical protein